MTMRLQAGVALAPKSQLALIFLAERSRSHSPPNPLGLLIIFTLLSSCTRSENCEMRFHPSGKVTLLQKNEPIPYQYLRLLVQMDPGQNSTVQASGSPTLPAAILLAALAMKPPKFAHYSCGGDPPGLYGTRCRPDFLLTVIHENTFMKYLARFLHLERVATSTWPIGSLKRYLLSVEEEHRRLHGQLTKRLLVADPEDLGYTLYVPKLMASNPSPLHSVELPVSHSARFPNPATPAARGATLEVAGTTGPSILLVITAAVSRKDGEPAADVIKTVVLKVPVVTKRK
ncbi:hypothetical protein EI94DRAFT_1703586 [Lactarius quietus]|nr:hypothetical protein EI94DRAFT_1703586 [Lactarius quietus]